MVRGVSAPPAPRVPPVPPRSLTTSGRAVSPSASPALALFCPESVSRPALSPPPGGGRDAPRRPGKVGVASALQPRLWAGPCPALLRAEGLQDRDRGPRRWFLGYRAHDSWLSPALETRTAGKAEDTWPGLASSQDREGGMACSTVHLLKKTHLSMHQVQSETLKKTSQEMMPSPRCSNKAWARARCVGSTEGSMEGGVYLGGTQERVP